jgi:hypothetical protein
MLHYPALRPTDCRRRNPNRIAVSLSDDFDRESLEFRGSARRVRLAPCFIKVFLRSGTWRARHLRLLCGARAESLQLTRSATRLGFKRSWPAGPLMNWVGWFALPLANRHRQVYLAHQRPPFFCADGHRHSRAELAPAISGGGGNPERSPRRRKEREELSFPPSPKNCMRPALSMR